MSKKMNMGVQVALDMAAEDAAVRCVVLTGAGSRAFCAGGQLGDERDGAATGFLGRAGDAIPPTAAAAVRKLRFGMMSSVSLRQMEKPTLAAINGACAGAGLSWACACDLRFAAATAIFRTAFITAGLSGDYGLSWTLPRIVGSAKARELFLLNRKVTADEALRIGLVAEVVPADALMETVMATARQIAQGPPLAVGRIKRNLNEADELTCFGEALDREAERHARTAMHPDAAEAGAAFVGKRAPSFVGVGAQEPWRSRL
mmetsp:Transcript_82411/g.247172  ORF Transcript_82411/g.247172 Transcript_82411/m.247172 type:complete len:260 (+) Transcript_82411:1-780(+)